MHRLDEMDEYIQCVQSIYQSLNEREIHSAGLLALKEYVKDLYEDNGFSELQKDIAGLKTDASDIKSVTLGINLNNRFERMASELFQSTANILQNPESSQISAIF